MFQLNAQTGNGLPTADENAFSGAVGIYTGPAKQFAADNLGNVYVLTTTGQMIKLNSRGDSLSVFNEVRRYGTIYALDVTNPMKLLLYYKDFSTIVMLDRFLNKVNTIDLRKQGIFQVKAIGLSFDNNIWLYDEQTARLKKIDDNGRMLSETVDLRQVLDITPNPVKIIDRDGLVYVMDTGNGLLVFDYFGSLKNTIALKDISDLEVIGKTIVGRRLNTFIRYTPATLELREAPLPAAIQQAKQIVIARKGIYVLNDKGIELYPYQ